MIIFLQVNNGDKLNPSIRKQIGFEQISKSYKTFEEYTKMLIFNLLLELAYKIQNGVANNDKLFR